MKSQELIQKAIQAICEEKMMEPKATLTQVARDLGINRVLLSRIRHGHVRVGAKMVEKVLRGRIAEDEYSRILKLLTREKIGWDGVNSKFRLVKDLDRVEFWRDPRHGVAIAASYLANFEPQVQWYADRIGCDVSETQPIVDRLIRLGFLHGEGPDFLKPTELHNVLFDLQDMDTEMVRDRRKAFLAWQQKIVKLPRGSFTSWDLAFPASEKDLPWIKERLEALVAEIKNKPKRYLGKIYCLQASVFPFEKD